MFTTSKHFFHSLTCSYLDECKVKNGGCDVNADCSHNATTNAVVCTCKVGYTDTAPETDKTVCTGNSDSYLSKMNGICHFLIYLMSRQLSRQEWWM